MRILVLTKRQYMNHDLIDDRYGRFRELPLALAAADHEVAGICHSYRTSNEGRLDDVEKNAKVVWHFVNFKRIFSFGSKSYHNTIDTIEKDFHPDLVWACSDALHAILGEHVAKRIGTYLVIDLYDNFESYLATSIPGMTKVFRRALRHADGITCVSRPLKEYVHNTTSCNCPIEVIENAVPEDLFQSLNQLDCRRELGLPTDGIMIGTAGAISRSRGIETLIKAFEKLSQERSDVHMALAGTCDKGFSLPDNPRIHYLGALPPEKVPVLLSCLNVSVICNRDSDFGRYCFPQKFYESVACRIPVVAAETGSMKELLKDNPGHLFKPENVEDLVTVLRNQIDKPATLELEAQTWTKQAYRLEKFFKLVCERSIQ
jgi:teichuronic acid biosynthesis glycosyltransferase TuaC